MGDHPQFRGRERQHGHLRPASRGVAAITRPPRHARPVQANCGLRQLHIAVWKALLQRQTTCFSPASGASKFAGICRVLYGQLHVRGYDWEDSRKHTARLAADSELGAGEIAVLGPDFGGNMHCLTAVTDVAIFDVLAPAYNPKGGETRSEADRLLMTTEKILLQTALCDPGAGRDCTYYAVTDGVMTTLKVKFFDSLF